MEEHPMHYTVAAEFSVGLRREQVAAALAAVQERHPLLQAQIEDSPGIRLGFHRPASLPAIDVRLPDKEVTSWPQVVAEELSRPFDPSRAPLARAVLLSGDTRSVVLLTVYHCITDGIGAVSLLDDMAAALDGRRLERLPLPPSQEQAIANTLPPLDGARPEQSPTEEDPRLAPCTLRPFDGTLPHVSAMSLDAEHTQQLVRRCHSEGTTVHGALVSAVSRARSALNDECFVRVLSPFDLRKRVGGGGACVDYHGAARTASEPGDGRSLWEQAREVNSALSGPRSDAGIVAASTGLQQFVPADADNATATAAISAFPYDILVSNLGVVDCGTAAGAFTPTAVWGPAMLVQVKGEDVLGVTTHGGRLHMICCGYSPTEALLRTTREILCRESG
ncbi:condensation domain-containing protein [Streptomyces sp. NPDC047002]|uniref:condensation domain-containing protein n=1 Tax=Streptomyces sp. NPDC047002 TaxID=3155475 RepID=UPI003452CA73